MMDKYLTLIQKILNNLILTNKETSFWPKFDAHFFIIRFLNIF